MFRQATKPVFQAISKSRFSALIRVVIALPTVLLLLVLSAYMLRNTLAVAVIEWQGADQQITVECLDFNLDWHFNVTVSEACVRIPNAKMTLTNALWLRTAQDLSIEQVHVTHLVEKPLEAKKNTSPSTAFAPLPKSLPTLHIKSLQIESPYLAQGLSLEIRFNQQQQLSVSGAINAQLQWVDHAIRAKVGWSLAEVFAVVPQLQTLKQQHVDLLSDQFLNAANFVSELSFDGRQLSSISQVQFNDSLRFDSCALNLDMQGRVGLDIDVQNPTYPSQLDLSQLNTLIDIHVCGALPRQYSNWPITRFTLVVPQPISYEKGQIDIPATIVQWESPNGNEQTNHVTLSLTKLALDASLTSELSWLLDQNVLPKNYLQGLVATQGSAQLGLSLQVGDHPVAWQIQQGRASIVASDMFTSLGSFKSASSELEFSASNSVGLQIKATNNVANIAADTFNISSWQSQIDANVDPQLMLKLTSSHTVQDLSFKDWASKTITTTVNGELQALQSKDGEQAWTAQDLTAQFNIQAENANYQQNALKGLHSRGTIEGQTLNDLRIQTSTQVEKALGDSWQITGLTNQLRFTIEKLYQVYFQGKSTLNTAQLTIDKKSEASKSAQKPQKIRLSDLSVDHQGEMSLDLASSQTTHNLRLLSGVNLQIEQQNNDVQLQMENQDLAKFQTLIKQVLPEFALTDGELSASLVTKLKSDLQVTGNVAVKNLSGHYATTLFNGVQGQGPFSFNSGGLQFASTTLRINSVNGGIPIDNIEVTLQGTDNQILLQHGQGELLGGRFSLNNLWLDAREQQFDIGLHDLDLAKIVALQDQPGIKVTGSIGGKMPVNTNPQGVNIENGRVVSNGGGTLSIKGNPAFDSIKEQQQELALLENYKFSQLSSQVSLKPDGLMIIDFAFVGSNPDKKQAVNFNFNYQENLFALLQTLNVARGIQDKIEQSITQGGK
jgi:hypothetical protein